MKDPSITDDNKGMKEGKMDDVEIESASSAEQDEEKGQTSDDFKTEESKGDSDVSDTKPSTFWSKLCAFYHRFEFPIHIMIAISIARAYPPLGADYLKPKLSASWIAVAVIFFISGVGLKTKDLVTAMFRRPVFNVYVECYNFLFVSAVVFGISRLIRAYNVLPDALADGMVICSCLPMSINAVIVLTSAARGDEALAIFHTTLSNMSGVFLSPVLIVLYLPAASTNVDLPTVFSELTIKVIVPLFIGQVAQYSIRPLREFYAKHKKIIKKFQESCLVFIVFTIFSKKFAKNEKGNTLGDVFLLILFTLIIMTSLKLVAWFSLRQFFHDEPEMRIMGLYGCTQKTIALGIPLIMSIYKGSEFLSLYTLPILIWHPMQLVVGSTLIPRLHKFLESERERLGQCPQPAAW